MDQDLLQEKASTPSLGRKRLRDASPDSASVTNMTLNDTNEDIPSIRSLSLEAIFHPKFENENRNDQDIRRQMKERVLSGKGYLEVSLKHSGSLLLWSGGQRYYSKNSTENQFTYVGELLLRQHMFRAWQDYSPNDLEKKYRECSEYVEEHRLTLAFEVVTAILGHHGDIPHRDFLILTAVADRNTERFYSTSELIEFAQRFRLPHNDTWAVSSESGVDGLFHLYDTTRETGLAEDTVKALNNVADLHVSSIYPHCVFQGNILEGIVIRYVPHCDQASEEELLRKLAVESRHILETVPPETPPSFVLTQSLADGVPLPPVLTTDIRAISRVVMATGNREEVSSFLQATVRNILCESDGGERRTVDSQPLQVNKAWAKNFPEALKQALVIEDADTETVRIMKLVETLDSLTSKVTYRVVKESTKGQPARWLCIVHVLYDATHQKFRHKMNPDDMALFRGFCFELGRERNQARIDVDNASVVLTPGVAENSPLMLKMKFLPYMVRTFGCRNGLRVISDKGPLAFADYTMKLLSKWGTSPQAKAKWQPFFRAWGEYAQICLKEEVNQYADGSLPRLCDSFYLEHLEHFTRLFESGAFAANDVQSRSACTSTFRGLVIVVGLNRERADKAADVISESLGGLYRCQGLHKITSEDWASTCLLRDRGMVCSAVVSDGVKGVRKQLKEHGDAMFMVMVGCDDEAVTSLPVEDLPIVNAKEGESPTNAESVDGSIRIRKLQGMISAWRKTRFASVLEISDSPVLSTGNKNSSNDDSIEYLIAELNKASDELPQPDDRPGLLVFFPGIPGSGKSTLCSSDSEPDTEAELRRLLLQMNEHSNSETSHPRSIVIRSGDDAKKKYWPLVNTERAKDPSSIYIADKNAPPAAWSNIGQVCSLSRGIAVPVIPDENALKTTSVEGAKYYPFSLHYLAVCMARVLGRAPSSHAGKLDSSTDLACMVVVKFFALYRKESASEFLVSLENSLLRAGAEVSRPIRIPFFAEAELAELPSDLVSALSDAIRIQYEYDMRGETNLSADDERVMEIESRLRELLAKYSDMLMSLSVAPSVSKRAFINQAVERVAELAKARTASHEQSSEEKASDFIKIVSVDVNVGAVLSLVQHCAETHPPVSSFLEMAMHEKDDAELTATIGDCVVPRDFEADTHVTMAHFSQLTQSVMREQFGEIVGCEVNVTVTGILWSSRVAALAVEVGTETDTGLRVPAPMNSFPHITLWHPEEVSAVESNELPVLVENNNAQRFDFCEPIVLKGMLSFWGEESG